MAPKYSMNWRESAAVSRYSKSGISVCSKLTFLGPDLAKSINGPLALNALGIGMAQGSSKGSH